MKALTVLLVVFSLSASAQKSDVKIDQSVVKWTGYKIGGSHTGEIKLKSGWLLLKGGDIKEGSIVMDMNSITNTDLTDAGYNQKLIGHLKSDDFFGVASFPTASFQISEAGKFRDGRATVSGILTIKGKSEKITFEVVKNGSIYSAQVKVDRSKFNVRYGSASFFDNLGDKAIDDQFLLGIQLAL